MGFLNEAPVPEPLSDPAAPDPARVETEKVFVGVMVAVKVMV